MPRRKAASATAVAPAATDKAMESNKENVAAGACEAVPKSPPTRAAGGRGLKNARNWEEELEAMTQKMNKMKLEKEETERLAQEQAAKIKEQHDKIELQSKEQEKLQEKLKRLQKMKEFQPVLSMPLPEESSDDSNSKGKKKKNDPDRIKRPVSAFLLWCNDQREKVRAENPKSSLTELSAKLGEIWKTVSEEEKKPYMEIYQKSKEEYLKLVSKERKEAEGIRLLQEEQSRILSKEIYDQYIEYIKETKAGEKSKKKEKDPEKPKRPMSGYMVYSQERRPALMAEKIKLPQIAQILGKEWRGMNEEARAPYEKMAVEAKAVYADEMEAYNKKKAEEEKVAEKATKEKAKRDRICGLQMLKQKEKEDEAKKALKQAKVPRKPRTKSSEPGMPKKGATAYILFSKDYRKKLQEEMPKAKFGELNALIANRWGEMSPEEKQPYVDQAAIEKQKYEEALQEFNNKKAGTTETEGGAEAEECGAEAEAESEGEGDAESETSSS